MPRISTYNPDSSLSGEDKVIGSSYEGQDVHGPVYVTKNYTLSQLAQFFGSFIDTGEVLVNIQEIEQNVTNNTNAIATANQSITVIANEQLAQSTFQTNLSSTFGTFDSEGNLTSLSQAFADQVLQTTASDRYANAQFVTNLAASVGTYDANGNLVTLGQAFADQVLSTTASDRFATSTFATNLAASFGTYNPDGTLSTISSSFANQLLEASTESDFASATSVQNLGASFGTVNPDGSVSFTNTSTYASEILNYVDSSSALATQVSNLETTVTNIPQTIRQPEPPDVNAFPLGSIWVDTDDANAIYILTDGTPRTWEPTTSEALGDLILSNAALQEEVNLLSDDISAEATKLTTLTAQFGVYDPATNTFTINNNANVVSSLRTYADSESAAASKVDGINSVLNMVDASGNVIKNEATFLQEIRTDVDANSATAQAVTNLTATVGDENSGLVASVQTTSDTVADIENGVKASYGLTVGAGNAISSMKLLAEDPLQPGLLPTSSIVFNTDNFKIQNGSGVDQFTINTVTGKAEFSGHLQAATGSFLGTLTAGQVSIVEDQINIGSNGDVNFINGGSISSTVYNGGNAIGITTDTFVISGDSFTSGGILAGGSLGLGGGITATSILLSSGIIAGGNITAPDFVLSSDRSLKENIEDYAVKPINIEYKSYNLVGSEEKRVGVIAQELEVNHPEFVRENEEGIKSVSYIDMLVAKVAELEARIKELENGNTK